MKSLKLLAEQYETIYVKNIIEEASAAELLEAFELANNESSNIKNILVAINNGSFFINESGLSDDEKTFFSAATKLVTFYKENANIEYNTRFESLLSDAQARDASGRFVKGGVKPSGGIMSKIGGFLGNIGKGIAKGFRAFLKGFAGSEGKSKEGKANPGWQDIPVKTDLSSVSDKTTVFTPQQLAALGVTPDVIKKLQNGKLAGLNLTDTKNNLVSLKYQNGQYAGTKVPAFKQAADAGAADPAAKATAPAAPVATAPADPVDTDPTATDPADPVDTAPTATATAAPVPLNKDEQAELSKLKSKKGFSRTAEDNVRIKELSARAGKKAKTPPGTALESIISESVRDFYITTNKHFRK